MSDASRDLRFFRPPKVWKSFDRRERAVLPPRVFSDIRVSLEQQLGLGCRLVRLVLSPCARDPLGGPGVVRIWYALPPETLLAIPAWTDALEGRVELEGEVYLWVAQEVSRGIRELLRQSVSGLEMLSPCLLEPDPWRDALGELLPSLISRGGLRSLCAMSEGLDRASEAGALRFALMALRLAEEGVLCLDFEELRRWGRGKGALGEVLERLLVLQDSAGLPERPEGFAEVNGFLVRLRLACLGGR